MSPDPWRPLRDGYLRLTVENGGVVDLRQLTDDEAMRCWLTVNVANWVPDGPGYAAVAITPQEARWLIEGLTTFLDDVEEKEAT